MYMENTSKNFALQLGSLISLYVSLAALIGVLFAIITIAFPDPAQDPYEYETAASTLRTSIAVLIVFFPAYIMLTRFVNTIRRSESGAYLSLTRWVIYLSLLIGGAVLLGDLVAVINNYLNGELTTRFLLKALSVLIVVGAAFSYYLADVRGYWQTHEKESIRYGMAVSVLVLIALVAGFRSNETPSEVRERNIDRTQISDLMNVQSYIESYAYTRGTLPTTIEEAYGGIEAPQAPRGRTPYAYEAVGADSFKLCAEFSAPSRRTDRVSYPSTVAEPLMIKNPFNWDYEAGMWCFERVLNPGAQKGITQ
jgi:hypothetical protein